MQVQCSCGQQMLGAPGSVVACPRCTLQLQVPVFVNAHCVKCAAVIAGAASTTVSCPSCSQVQMMPGVTPAQTEAPVPPPPPPAPSEPSEPCTSTAASGEGALQERERKEREAAERREEAAAERRVEERRAAEDALVVGSRVRFAEEEELDAAVRARGWTLNAEARAAVTRFEDYRHEEAKILRLHSESRCAELIFLDGSTAGQQRWPLEALRAV
eukprot:Hpha_TRINITY_DN15471_c5_g16::TRINITY_DN15471_c5_g16_i1::g.176780::m.176780